jgi:PAS domain S-box-containing protein
MAAVGGEGGGEGHASAGPGPAETELLDALSDGVIVANDQLRIVYANRVVHQMTGWTAPDLVGQSVEVIIPKSMVDAHREGVERFRHTGDGPYLHGRIRTHARRRDGAPVLVSMSIRALDSPAGRRFSAVLRDEREVNLPIDTVLAAVADGVYGLDNSGRVQFVNPAAVRLTGYTQQDQLGQRQHDLIHGRRPDGTIHTASDCPIMATLRDGEPRDVLDDVFWRADDTPLSVDYSTAPLTIDGQLAGVVVTFRDAAIRKEAEKSRLLQVRAAVQRQVIAELQHAIVPPRPTVPGYRTDVVFQPAGGHAPTGGDLYDWALLPDGSVHLCLVDIAGHDVSATKQALAAVHTIRALVLAGTPQAEVLPQAGSLLETQHPDLSATALVVNLQPETGRYQVHIAGHPPPLRLTAAGASYLQPDGTPLGAPQVPPTLTQVGRLEPGDSLLVYTDGLVEAGGDLAAGMERLRTLAEQWDLRGRGEMDLRRVAATLTSNRSRTDDVLAVLATRSNG